MISGMKHAVFRDHVKLGQILRDLRCAAKLKQADVAARLGVPQSFVSKYESGERRLDFVEVARICEVLGVRFSDLARRFEGGR